MEALTSTFLIILLAELGDKTQFLVIAFAAKYDWRKVLLGMTIGIAVVHSLAVAVGSVIGAFIPETLMQVAAALIFLAFGVLTLRAGDEEEEATGSRFGPVRTVAMAFIVGEMGDKTQIAAMTMAAEHGAWLPVLIGAVGGMLVADFLGLICGATLNRQLPARKLKLLSGILFLLFGALGLYDAAMDYWS